MATGESCAIASPDLPTSARHNEGAGLGPTETGRVATFALTARQPPRRLRTALEPMSSEPDRPKSADLSRFVQPARLCPLSCWAALRGARTGPAPRSTALSDVDADPCTAAMSEIRYIFRTLRNSEKPLHISDMADASLMTSIQERIAGAKPRHVWTPSDFLDLGPRDAVDKVLQRKVKRGDLRRIDRGLYDRPAYNSLLDAEGPPDPLSVIDAVARRDKIRVLIDGMAAANDLGFTNAVPARIVVRAESRLRPIRLGAMTIEFRQTAASKLFWAGRPAMRLVQALHWMSDSLGADAEARRIRRILDGPAGPAVRADLVAGFTALPAWMQDYLRPMLAGDLNSPNRGEPPE